MWWLIPLEGPGSASVPSEISSQESDCVLFYFPLCL